MMAVQNHAFHADAAIITRLGRQLVAKQETALIELVKNAYDADATHVTVSFIGRGQADAVIEIQDNGSGMDRVDLLDRFLKLASENKVANPKSNKFKRTRAGRKGIGRFSTQRLGDRLILTTYAEGEPFTLRLIANWSEFTAGRRLEDVNVTIEELPPGVVGTIVRIEALHDTWTPGQIRGCWRGVLALQQPFPVAPPIAGDADPGFEVRFIDGGGLFEDSAVIADMQSEILDHLPVIIEMRVDGSGFASWRVTKNAFGELRDWTPIHDDSRDAVSPPAYKSLRNVHMKAYHVILLPALLPSMVFTRVRDVLREEGGIRLYRNGFRVTPYGEPEDDWLGLDEVYAKRDFLAPIANRNFFGVVEVRDPEGALFEEHTSREGLIENVAFRELRDLTSSVLITAATEVHNQRGRKARTKSPGPDPIRTAAFSDARAALRAAREAAERVAVVPQTIAIKELVERAVEAEQAIEAEETRLTSERVQLADEAAMLRLLASIGMTTAEFSHETGMSFEAFRLDLEKVFEVALQVRGEDEVFVAQADRAHEALGRLDTLTSYLNTTVASRAIREIHPVSISKSVEDFNKGLSAYAKTQSTEIIIETPPFDALYTRPMHAAEIASVLLNFQTNALKAMKRTDRPRRILIVADRMEEESKVRLRFSDTGDGVPDELRTKIFEPFFTTQSAPAARAEDNEHARGTGLGLWIVDQIASNAGGEVEVVDPPQGYATCFELRLPQEEADG